MPADQSVWINTENLRVCKAATGDAPASPQLVFYAPFDWRVQWRAGSAGKELAEGTTANLVLKKPLDLEGNGRLIIDLVRIDDDAWSCAAAHCDSALLRTDLAGFTKLEYAAQFKWTEPGEEEERSNPFTVVVLNSPAQPTEEAPDPATDAGYEALKARLVAGTNVTLTPDDEAKTITIAATGGSGGGGSGTEIVVTGGFAFFSAGGNNYKFAVAKI